MIRVFIKGQNLNRNGLALSFFYFSDGVLNLGNGLSMELNQISQTPDSLNHSRPKLLINLNNLNKPNPMKFTDGKAPLINKLKGAIIASDKFQKS